MKPASDDARFAPPPDDPVLNAPDPTDVDQDLLVFFLMECAENFDNIEASLLAHEKNPSATEPAKTIYRLAHSTKGAANSMGFAALGGLFHHVEDLMEDVVEGNARPRPADLANLLLSTLDVSKAMLADFQAGKPLAAHRPKLRELLTGLIRLRALSAIGGEKAEPAAAPAPQPDFAPAATELAATAPLPEIEDDPSESASDSDLRVLRVETERVDAVARLLDELVIARTRLERDIAQLMGLRKELARSRQRLTHVVAEFQERFEFSLSRGQPLGGHSHGVSPAASPTTPDGGFSDLELDRYDDFNILTRALVEISADSGEIISSLNRQFGTLTNDTADFSSATSRLQEEMLHMRMVPLRRLFQQLQRGVRDAAQAEGKLADLHLDGGKVRIDKIIFDKLVTPLLHLVRNAVSHGIEPTAERLAKGKPETGLITFRAEQDGNHVRLSIRDDGRGIDLAVIREVATRKGLLKPGETASDERLKNIIFEPGFSTASTVSSVSGRGVGMDIVRQELIRLNGAIELHSEPGRGTLFSLRLPLTTSVNQAVIIRVGGQQLALPLNYVEHVEEGFEDNIEIVDGHEFVKHNGQRVPLVRLDLLLGFSDGSNPAGGDIVIAAVGADLLAVHVDEVLQRQDIVVKPLGPLFSKHSFLSGVTLTGGGRMVLVLDLPGIARKIRTSGLASAHARHTQFNAPSGKAAEARTVLVVDDSLSIRKISESYVTQLGYPVETAVDGADALAKLQGGNGRYGMVLSDLEMPRMNGFELIREMRKAEGLRDIPVVVVTSRDAEKHRQAASEAGANAYVTKPFTTDQLGQFLRTYLSQERSVTSRRILVVDDSLSIRKIGENYVSALGYEVDVAVDGLDALEKLRAKDYGLVLSDLEMPRMNGFELIGALRREERLKNIPVVIVTSRDAAKHRARAEFEGAQGYITKPFTQEQLGERITHVLDQIANPPAP